MEPIEELPVTRKRRLLDPNWDQARKRREAAVDAIVALFMAGMILALVWWSL